MIGWLLEQSVLFVYLLERLDDFLLRWSDWLLDLCRYLNRFFVLPYFLSNLCLESRTDLVWLLRDSLLSLFNYQWLLIISCRQFFLYLNHLTLHLPDFLLQVLHFIDKVLLMFKRFVLGLERVIPKEFS